jgi:hypothetical protein
MQETWDVSALIDKGMRIHEARGMTKQHLGIELRHVANRAFIDFVTPAQRAWFRRCIAKLTSGEELGIITADLQIGGAAPRSLFVTARPAKAQGKWWLMLTANLPEALRAAVRGPDQPALASGHEFMQLVESAALQTGDRLDLTRVHAAIFKDESAASPETRASLQGEFDQIVLAEAYDGIASHTDVGEYLLLRDREVPSESLLSKLGAAAERHAIPQSQLGLEANALYLSALGPNLNPAGLRRAAVRLRHLTHPAHRWEGAVMKQPFLLRPAVLAVGAVAILGIGWLTV